MSLIRKMFKPSIKKVSSATENLNGCSSGGAGIDSSQSDVEADLMDVFRIEKRLVLRKEDLNTKLKKYSIHDRKLVRLQMHLLQIHEELIELRRMLRHMDMQKKALDDEIDRNLEEMKEVINSVPTDCEAEIKKKEPVFFRRYSNIKCKADAKSLLGSLKSKQTVLRNLELLTYKTYLQDEHGFKKESPIKSPRSKIHTGALKKPKRNFQARFNPASMINPFQYSNFDAATSPQPQDPVSSSATQENRDIIELHPANHSFSDLDLEDDDLDDDVEAFERLDHVTLVTDV